MHSFIRYLVAATLALASHAAVAAEITPFATSNQSPLVMIFGLPAADRSSVLPPGAVDLFFGIDAANNFAKDKTGTEEILLDGESYRLAFAARRGFTNGFEAGVEVPFIGHGGGVFDNFIEGWHDFFGLPDGGRTKAAHNRLRYGYVRQGETRLLVNDSSFGIGDVRLSGGMQLYRGGEENPRALAVRASLKLPTGESSHLHGSGSTDIALWLTGSDDYRLPIGHATLFGALGGMGMTDGSVLKNQQKNLVGYATVGAGWAPATWIDFKTQVSGHTAFYSGSELRELSNGALQLLVGGSLTFSGTSVDIGVSEDIAVNTSPDVALHLSLRRRF